MAIIGIIGIVVGVVVLAGAIVTVCILLRKRKATAADDAEETPDAEADEAAEAETEAEETPVQEEEPSAEAEEEEEQSSEE